MAEVTSSVGAIDMALVMMVSNIVHMPFPSQDFELGSVIVFSQATVERRFQIVRQIITMRLRVGLDRKPHEFPHKACEFILKAFNVLAADVAKNLWIRNLAAHGSFFHDKNRLTLIPSPFDFDAMQRLHDKRGGKGKVGFVSENGFTEPELLAVAKETKALLGKFHLVTEAVRIAMTGQFNPALEAALAELGKGLKMTPPRLVRPRREAKPKPGAK